LGQGVGVGEARLRFAQYAVLRAVASSAFLRRILVFKGGNALDFVWSPNRSTLDLDFSADMSAEGAADLGEAGLEGTLSRALNVSGRELGVVMRVHGVRRQPPGEGKTFVTYTARIGYALPGDQRNRTLLEAGQSSQYVVPLEVSINEPIGADENLDIGGGRSLRVGTLEDIVAEKLRAFLQQKGEIRNRTRPQDLLDVAHLLRRGKPLNLDEVSRFLLTKAEARNVPVSKEAFRDPELARRANHEYDQLRNTVRAPEGFVPFDEALKALYGLVEKLDVPERQK
jgi:predicted nucleotidyltransferase component of viral defense system